MIHRLCKSGSPPREPVETLEQWRRYKQYVSRALAGALLHNFGKLSSLFLAKMIDGEDNGYRFHYILGLVEEDTRNPPGPLDQKITKIIKDLDRSAILKHTDCGKVLRQACIHLPPPLDDRVYRPGDMIEYLGSPKRPVPWYDDSAPLILNLFDSSRLTHLIHLAHGAASGGEKEKIFSQKLSASDPLYMATPFGRETRIPGRNTIDGLREKAENIISELIPPNLSLRQFQEQLQPVFSRALADIRRPLNDITLWDIGHSGAAFFLAFLLTLVLKQKNVDHASLGSKTPPLGWRILKVTTDGLGYLEQAGRLVDIRVRKKHISSLWSNARKFIEDNLLGTEIYRDENGCFFLVPDIDPESGIYHQAAAELAKRCHADLLRADITLSAPLASAWEHDARERAKVLELLIPAPGRLLMATSQVVEAWQGKPGELCEACGLRPKGYGAGEVAAYQHNTTYYSNKARDRNICCVCMEARTGAAKKWAGLSDDFTIWIDEVADSNGRLALIVGRLDLDLYLAGHVYPPWERVTTCIPVSSVQNSTLADNTKVTCRLDGSNIRCRYRLNITTTQQYLDREQVERLEPTQRGITLDPDGTFYQPYPRETRASRFHSFARMRRAWMCTKQFWQDMKALTRDHTEGRKRLEIRGTLQPHSGATSEPGKFHAYELQLAPAVRMNLVWDPRNKRFISADNLQYLEQLLDIQEKKSLQSYLLDNGPFTVEEPGGYGKSRTAAWTLDIGHVSTTGQTYHPAMPILAEPRTFSMLVPANAAVDILNGIIERFEEEFGKVRHTLPLNLGVVFAHHRTPLHAILDAGRRMLERKPTQPEPCRVLGVKDTRNSSAAPAGTTTTNQFRWQRQVTLQSETTARQFKWTVPLKMGDGETDDIWYPFVRMASTAANHPLDDRAFTFQVSDTPGQKASDTTDSRLHARELLPGDTIFFSPSTVDWIWLDRAARRFEISYDPRGLRPGAATRHLPLSLEEFRTLRTIWNTIEKHLSTSQITALTEEVARAKARWRETAPAPTFRAFCRDLLKNTHWLVHEGKLPWDGFSAPEEWFNQWSDYLANGLFDDAVVLSMKVLRQRPLRDKEQPR